MHYYPFLCYEMTESNSEPTRLNISETIVRYDSHSYTLFLTVAILRFFKKGINFVITVAFYNDTAYARVSWFENWPVWRYLSWSSHENTWILRTSFTASWKTNNHSSSCTLQTEHHFIHLYRLCIVKIQLQNISNVYYTHDTKYIAYLGIVISPKIGTS